MASTSLRPSLVLLSLVGLLAAGTAPLRAQGVQWKAETTRVGAEDLLIILNNCDDSDADGKPDNWDAKINGPHDWKQLEPIGLLGQADGPVTVKLTFNALEPFPLRLFRVTSTTGPGGVPEVEEIIGPSKKTQRELYTLSREDLDLLAANKLTFFAEGLDFAVQGKLSVQTGGKEDILLAKTAPLLLIPHTQPALKSMVVRMQNKVSEQYVSQFESHCRTAGVMPFVVSNTDQWMEDEMQWGCTETPKHQMHVALHMSRNKRGGGGLFREIPKLLGPGIGYYALYFWAKQDHALYFGGNFEVTPPTPKHPFGRVYFGSKISPAHDGSYNSYPRRQMNNEYVQFFHRQKLQDPIELWTDWLVVGHVDEAVTFLPAKNDKGFVMALASPRRALELLDLENLEGQPQRDRGLHERYRHYGLSGVDDLKDERRLLKANFMGLGVERFNNMIHAKIHGVDFDGKPAPSIFPTTFRGQLQKALGLNEDEIVEIPTLFGNFHPPAQGWSACALTPGMVNLTSLGRYAMVPDPFIDAFRKDVEQTFQKLGQQILWIDDWFIYHINEGEVHCGSNTQRQPFAQKWWQTKNN